MLSSMSSDFLSCFGIYIYYCKEAGENDCSKQTANICSSHTRPGYLKVDF